MGEDLRGAEDVERLVTFEKERVYVERAAGQVGLLAAHAVIRAVFDGPGGAEAEILVKTVQFRVVRGAVEAQRAFPQRRRPLAGQAQEFPSRAAVAQRRDQVVHVQRRPRRVAPARVLFEQDRRRDRSAVAVEREQLALAQHPLVIGARVDFAVVRDVPLPYARFVHPADARVDQRFDPLKVAAAGGAKSRGHEKIPCLRASVIQFSATPRRPRPSACWRRGSL